VQPVYTPDMGIEFIKHPFTDFKQMLRLSSKKENDVVFVEKSFHDLEKSLHIKESKAKTVKAHFTFDHDSLV
jgi:hypothetical protein